jgi:hypothetical protein
MQQDGRTFKGHAPGEMEILELKWSKETPLPRGWDRPVYSPSRPPPYDSSSPGAGTPRRGRFPGGRRAPVYVYSVRIRNGGTKAITGIAWEYHIIDAGNNEELARHSFNSRIKIGATRSATLKGRSSTPPSRTVSVEGLEKDKRSPFIERVVIKRVTYADGTMWRNEDEESERPKQEPNQRNR